MALNYSKKVMQHFFHPKHAKEMKDFSIKGRMGNIKCGDIMEFYLKIKKDKIIDASFKTYGCTAAIACSDVLCEMVIGKKIKDALKITAKDIYNALGQLPPQKYHCSILGMETFRKTIENYSKKQKEHKKGFEKEKLNKLIKLAKTKKYSAPKLAKKFKCNRKTILKILKNRGIALPNLGQFKKRIYCNKIFFEKLNKRSAYWLGFIAADGVLSLRDKSVLIGLSEKDKKHLYKFKKAIKTNAKIGFIKSNRSAHIGICDKDLFESLVKRGVTPNKSLSIKKVKFPQRLSSHFIRGVFDGDGSISGSDISHIQLMIAGNKDFLEQLQDILIKNCKLNRTKIYRLTKGNAYKLQYTGSQIFKILKFLYRNSNENIRLDRKYKKYLIFKRKFKTDALHATILDYEKKHRK